MGISGDFTPKLPVEAKSSKPVTSLRTELSAQETTTASLGNAALSRLSNTYENELPKKTGTTTQVQMGKENKATEQKRPVLEGSLTINPRAALDKLQNSNLEKELQAVKDKGNAVSERLDAETIIKEEERMISPKSLLSKADNKEYDTLGKQLNGIIKMSKNPENPKELLKDLKELSSKLDAFGAKIERLVEDRKVQDAGHFSSDWDDWEEYSDTDSGIITKDLNEQVKEIQSWIDDLTPEIETLKANIDDQPENEKLQEGFNKLKSGLKALQTQLNQPKQDQDSVYDSQMKIGELKTLFDKLVERSNPDLVRESLDTDLQTIRSWIDTMERESEELQSELSEFAKLRPEVQEWGEEGENLNILAEKELYPAFVDLPQTSELESAYTDLMAGLDALNEEFYSKQPLSGEISSRSLHDLSKSFSEGKAKLEELKDLYGSIRGSYNNISNIMDVIEESWDWG